MASVMRAAVARCAVRAAGPRSVVMRHAQPRTSSSRHAAALRAFSTEKVTFTFIDAEGESTTVAATLGQSLLDVAHENDIELEGACGGELACSTCHLVFEKELFEKLPEISEEEEDMLDLAWGLTDTSRLGCQIKVTKDLEGTTVRVPDESNNLM
uniref:2Fe-2S ferredoxin-type domain-containing protein n=1 Tax=Globisporangium ultimum (strain ATCC 200006 / CBS 805.95 / DAOM BR144) TaxID=431595 RepID=K3W9Y4_GLOUD